MPRISPASNTSRKTTISAPIIPTFLVPRSLHDDRAAVALVEVVEELVAAGRQRTDAHRALALRRDHLFDAQADALELDRLGVPVPDRNDERLVRRRAQFGRLKAAVLNRHAERRFLRA